MRISFTMKHPFLRAFLLLLVVYAFLMIPLDWGEPPASIPGPNRQPFVWAQDSTWYALEDLFAHIRTRPCDDRAAFVGAGIREVSSIVDQVERGTEDIHAPMFATLEESIFRLSLFVAGCPDLFRSFQNVVLRTRNVVKQRSLSWDMNDPSVRDRLYRLLYGSRAALEQAMLQTAPDSLQTTVVSYDEPSSTPSTMMLGMRVHSGDVLVSRGGAPTSALIARGNDFPGNFSHIALVHIDTTTGGTTILESHIERGVTRSTVEEYVRDRKLRVMVLRLRSDHPSVVADPLLPHKAAQRAYDETLARHIPYDFAMDADDPDAWFCSELASFAYRGYGVNLWMGLSTISSEGLRRWLYGFGVRSFVTQEPSDLEYDPQLRVVAEWRDPHALFEDQLDNAVTEVMLEGAERGDRLRADPLLLPIARSMKLYSWVLNQWNAVGPIPEGMSAEAALRNEDYSRTHDTLVEQLRERVRTFEQVKGYRAPYWRMLEMVRAAR